jgi:ATP-binding cassette subfamily B protein
LIDNPRAAKQKLIIVGIGWIIVAAIEAIAYTVLAFAIDLIFI